MNNYLFFKVSDRLYALESTEVLEIGRYKDYTIYPIPQATPHCSGMLQHHGRIVPVVDTQTLLKSDNQTLLREPDNLSRLIFVNSRLGDLALIVDGISQDPSALATFGEWQFIQLSDFI